MTADTPPPLCSCQACRYGLFCTDGERGVFLRGNDVCQREACQRLAMDHSRVPCTRSKQ